MRCSIIDFNFNIIRSILVKLTIPSPEVLNSLTLSRMAVLSINMMAGHGSFVSPRRRGQCCCLVYPICGTSNRTEIISSEFRDYLVGSRTGSPYSSRVAIISS
jgi:hypothetical protein